MVVTEKSKAARSNIAKAKKDNGSKRADVTYR
jgi:hypothetical protein